MLDAILFYLPISAIVFGIITLFYIGIEYAAIRKLDRYRKTGVQLSVAAIFVGGFGFLLQILVWLSKSG